MPNALSRFVDGVGPQRIMVLLLGLGSVGVIWAFTQWGMAPSYVPVWCSVRGRGWV